MTTDNPEGAAPSAQQPVFGGSACAPAVGEVAGWRVTDETRALLGEIEQEFVALPGLAAWIRRLQDSLRAARAAAGPQVEQQPPVAWFQHQYITDDAGYKIGTDDPRMEWGKEPPEEMGWWPLYAAPSPQAPQQPLSVHQATPSRSLLMVEVVQNGERKFVPSHQAATPAESAQGRPSAADPASSQAAPRLDGKEQQS